MTETIARIKKDGQHFEILIDLEEALKIKKNESDNINSAVITESVFHNLKSGEHASEEELEKAFGTSNLEEVCSKIIKTGEIVMPSDYLKKGQDMKYKQIVDFLSKNAVSHAGLPYTPNRIMKALEEANVNVKNKPIDSQIPEIIEQIQRIIPIKVEIKKLKITVPSQHTGKAYGILNEYKESEKWKDNGDLQVIINIPAGLEMDFYDKLNDVTHGSALSEEVK